MGTKASHGIIILHGERKKFIIKAQRYLTWFWINQEQRFANSRTSKVIIYLFYYNEHLSQYEVHCHGTHGPASSHGPRCSSSNFEKCTRPCISS
jgi:hypothetical protein